MSVLDGINQLSMEKVLDEIANIVRRVDGIKEVWCQVDEGRAQFPPAAINTFPAALVFYERSVDYSGIAGLETDEYIVLVQVLSGPAAALMGANSRLAIQLRQRILDEMGNHVALGGLCTWCTYLPGTGLRVFEYGEVGL